MREIEIKINNRKLGIIVVNNIKYVIGTDIYGKDQLMTTINHLLSFGKESQYDLENDSVSSLKINGVKLNKSRIVHCHFDQQWSIDNDLKLGANSIAKALIVSRLPVLESLDELRLVNQMLEVICDSSIQCIESGMANIDFKVNPLVGMTLVKLIEARMVSEGIELNNRNLCLTDRLEMFIKLVNTISSNASDKTIFVTINLPIINDKIKNIIHTCNNANQMSVIFSEVLNTSVKTEDVLIMNSSVYDLSKESDLYNLVLNNGFGATVDECRDVLNNAFTNSKHGNKFNTQLINFINDI